PNTRRGSSARAGGKRSAERIGRPTRGADLTLVNAAALRRRPRSARAANLTERLRLVKVALTHRPRLSSVVVHFSSSEIRFGRRGVAPPRQPLTAEDIRRGVAALA